MSVQTIHGKQFFEAPTTPVPPVTTSLFQKTVTLPFNFIPHFLLCGATATGSTFHRFSGSTKAAMIGAGLGVVCASSTVGATPLTYIAAFLALAYCIFSLGQWLLSKLPFLLLPGTVAAGGLAAAYQGSLLAEEPVKLATKEVDEVIKESLQETPQPVEEVEQWVQEFDQFETKGAPQATTPDTPSAKEVDEVIKESLQETPQPVEEVDQWVQEFDQFETKGTPQATTPDTPSAQVEVPVASPQEVAAGWVEQYIEAPVTAPVVEMTALGSIGELASQFFAGEVAQMVSEFLEMGQGTEWSGEFLQF